MVSATLIYTKSGPQEIAEGEYEYPIEEVNPWEVTLPDIVTGGSENIWDQTYAIQNSLSGYAVEADLLPALEPLALEKYPADEFYNPIYKAGTITNGTLAGRDLLIFVEDGMGGSYYTPAVLIDGLVVPLTGDGFTFAYREEFPDTIDLPNTPYSLQKGYSGTTLFAPESSAERTLLFTDPVIGNVYRGEGQCMFAELPDHIGIAYDLDIPFANEANGSVALKLLSGSVLSEEYEFYNLGCGSLCRHLRYVEESVLKPTTRLVKVATDIITGDAIYGIADPKDQVLIDLYSDPNTLAYYLDDSWERQAKSKYTYDEFLSYQPLLYWKDPWGKWVEFLNKRFAWAAEKCKPVIYLYPKNKGNFHVEVAPNGGFTKTIPEYGDGWDVTAFPDGTLIEEGTGDEYPYLYWSGMGINYPPITEGFVVAQAEIDGFLSEKLYQLGLEGKEIDDFKEYWVPRLSVKPFYKITFLTKTTFGELAPLSVTGDEKPQSVIRVMMTAQGTNERVALPEQQLPPRPPRVGFTVVEWGGAELQ